MKKQETLNKIKDLESEINKLKYIINQPDNLFDIIKDYSDICKQLGEDELYHPNSKIQAVIRIDQIQRLFNGDWKPDFSDNNQEKWYPYFRYISGFGLVFGDCDYDSYGYYGQVAYYKDEKTAKFVGTKFIDLYKQLS